MKRREEDRKCVVPLLNGEVCRAEDRHLGEKWLQLGEEEEEEEEETLCGGEEGSKEGNKEGRKSLVQLRYCTQRSVGKERTEFGCF